MSAVVFKIEDKHAEGTDEKAIKLAPVALKVELFDVGRDDPLCRQDMSQPLLGLTLCTVALVVDPTKRAIGKNPYFDR